MDKRQKILIVDDSKLNRDILKEILGDAYNYLEAENGNQAIQMIGENLGIDLMLFLIRRNGQRICFFPVFQWETKDIGNGFVSSEDSRLGGYGMAALTNIGSSKIYFAIGQSHSDLKWIRFVKWRRKNYVEQ